MALSAPLEDVRREQICSAASKVIAERGFAGSTMRLIAERAGGSTGMLNHYFSNREEMLVETLLFTSSRMASRCRDATADVPAGEARVRALLRAALPTDTGTTIDWRVWLAAYGETVRSEGLRVTIQGRLEPWYEILEHTLEGIAPPLEHSRTEFVWQFDALLNGLAIQFLAARSTIELGDVEETVVAFCLGGGGHPPAAGSAGLARG